VHSDAEITAAKGMPVFNNDERMALVNSCKWVDEVVFDTPYNPTIELLDKLNCGYVAHGDDITATYKEVQDAGRLLIIKRTEGVSTTDIVGRLLTMTREHHTHQTSDPNTPASDFDAKKESKFLPTTRRITQFANGKAPKEGDRVVYIDGAFDLFHPGHVAALKAAKELGDFLYVGMHNDDLVNEKQGANYPICTLHERALCVLACKYVDEVIFGAPWEVSKDLVTLLNVSTVASSQDIKFPEGVLNEEQLCYKVPMEMGVYKNLDVTVEGQGHAEVVRRIVENQESFLKKFAKKGAAEEAYTQARVHVQEL